MPALVQPRLPLVIHASAALVTVESARIALGMDEDSVLGLVESGDLRWAWDIAVHPGRIREVRIWAQCLVARQQGDDQPGATLAAVTREILGSGPETRLRAAQVRALFCCSQQQIQRLVAHDELSGDVIGKKRWVTRASIESFLQRRRIQ